MRIQLRLLVFIFCAFTPGIGSAQLSGGEKKVLTENNTEESKKPNIVLFMVDDLGWQDTSLPFWKEETHFNKRYNTPGMERLANEGMKFTQAYACAVCSPTRVSLMTGMNAAHHRVTNWTLRKDEMPVRPPKGLTMPHWNMNGIGVDKELNNAIYTPQPLPKVLQENGYTTIHCGKAHFGALGTKAENPENIGFTVNIAGHAAGGPATYYGSDNFAKNEPSVWDIPGLEDYHGKDIFLTETLTREALKAVDKSVKDEIPFFLYMSHYAVHAPIMGDPRFEQKYLDAGLEPREAKYASMIEGMDKSLGDILDYVDSEGISDNTIVIFMSDNGGLSAHARGGEKHSHNYPLSSGKGSIHEGGIREPMIVKWPGVVKKRSTCDDYLIIEDFYPSILEMAGLENLDGDCQPIDGKSFTHKLKGKPNHDSNRPLFWHYPNNWGPHGPGIGTYSAIRKGDWKLIYYYTNESFELFNIAEDISEKNNLVKKEDVRAKQLATELSDYLRSVEAQRPTREETGKLVPWPDVSFNKLIAQSISVIPQPLIVEKSSDTYLINKSTKIITDAAGKENASYLQEMLAPAIELKIKKKGSQGIVLEQDKTLTSDIGIEGYKMQVSKEAIVIRAASQTGIFYGIQTLRQLLPLELKASNTTLTIPAISVSDSPRFAWRAYMLDESRYFQGEDFVKKILDEMALLKMNVFHWHLTDDAGWRIEIKKYPKLTEVGAFRKNSQIGPKKWQSEELSGEPHGGFYTQEQIKDIISYASARQITIIPEIEMPGHASAAIAAYPWLGTIGNLTEVPIKFGKLPDSYNVADAKVYEFIEDVLSEVMDLFPSKIIHIGGDEVKFDSWKESDEVQAFMKKNALKSPADLQIFFTNKVSNYIDKKEHRMMGWNEILGTNVHEWQKDGDYVVKEKLANSAVIHFWKGSLDLVNEAVSNGYDIVNSHHVSTYLDYSYQTIPLKKAYDFDPIPAGLEEKYYKQVLGSGCQMWTEWAPTNKDVERQTFPRIAAYAEVGWTRKERKNYQVFKSNLNQLLEHWSKNEVFFYSEFE